MPPPTQRWIRPSATANVRIVSASSKSPFGGSSRARPSTRRGRPARARAIWSSAAIFGAPVIEPPGNVASQDLGERRRRRAGGPRRSRRGASRRRARAAPSARASASCPARRRGRGRCARGRRSSRARRRPSPSSIVLAAGRVPLIGIVHEPVAAAGEEQLGRGGDDRPAVARRAAAAASGRSGASAGREPGRVAVERRREVLDEVHLVDVAARDRRAHRLDRGARSPRRPASAPTRRPGSELVPVWHCAGRGRIAAAASGQRARLGRRRPRARGAARRPGRSRGRRRRRRRRAEEASPARHSSSSARRRRLVQLNAQTVRAAWRRKSHAELEVGDRHALVGGVDQPRGSLGVHRRAGKNP